MNRPIWLYENSGSFVEGYLNEEEAKDRVAREVEAESRYTATHCYPYMTQTTLFDFICETKCADTMRAYERANSLCAENPTKDFAEEFRRIRSGRCAVCPVRKAMEEKNEL